MNVGSLVPTNITFLSWYLEKRKMKTVSMITCYTTPKSAARNSFNSLITAYPRQLKAADGKSWFQRSNITSNLSMGFLYNILTPGKEMNLLVALRWSILTVRWSSFAIPCKRWRSNRSIIIFSKEDVSYFEDEDFRGFWKKNKKFVCFCLFLSDCLPVCVKISIKNEPYRGNITKWTNKDKNRK